MCDGCGSGMRMQRRRTTGGLVEVVGYPVRLVYLGGVRFLF